MQQRKALGRGLESLIPPTITQIRKDEPKAASTLAIDQIVPNRMQPRTIFDDEKIRELADSIREDGVIQPLIVTPLHDGRYELIAGERRLRASRLAGLSEVPVVIKSVDQEGLLVLSLIENIQRQDLNPIEESHAYQELIDQFNLTQEDVAKRVGKSREAVANSLRLLKLPTVIQEDVASGRYSAGHARVLLSVEGAHEQLKLREWLVKNTPTVRNMEKKAQDLHGGKKQVKKNNHPPQVQFLLNKMRETLGTKIDISPNIKGGGKITIEYYSWQDLDRLYNTIMGGQ